ncbi:MAG: MerR family transcriptional regulator, partial [Bacteroidetes bacterium]|nr:MerR family transcriptional regulator [Bacteroidota bacterium]
AARLLGKSERTLKRWEERGLLERLNVSAPGVWYDHQAVLNLRRMS